MTGIHTLMPMQVIFLEKTSPTLYVPYVTASAMVFLIAGLPTCKNSCMYRYAKQKIEHLRNSFVIF